MTTEHVRVALAGNPNCGKTSLFNALTGAHQRVGNYPGVTVERREGGYTYEQVRYDVVDLPGTYSLSSYSPEERIAQRELTTGEIDVVAVVVDSTALGRALVLLAQVLQLGLRGVLCLNMWDEAEHAGLRLDLERMGELLGLPVIRTQGHKGVGVAELKAALAAQANAVAPEPGSRLVLGERLKEALDALAPLLVGTPLDGHARRWFAQRLLVADPGVLEELGRAGAPGATALQAGAQWRARLEAETRLDAALYVTERYYGFVDGLLREVVLRPSRADARAVSDRIDALLVHRVLGLPIFLGVMYLLFWVTFRVGEIPMGWIEAGVAWLGQAVGALWPAGSASPLRSLLVDGVISGVGGVLVFLPNIVLLFLGLALLEDSGYMARAAFLMDRLLHRFGLHGQSFIPMVTGFGCSIPGIMATRILDNERDRLTTMMVVPLMSCGARLPIWMLLVPAFFPPAWRAPALWGIYLFGALLALVVALLLRRSILKGDEAPFVMELPPYRMPTLRALGLKTGHRAWTYARKAGTVILGISVLMWTLTSFPKASHYEVDAELAAGRLRLVSAPAGEAQAAASARTAPDPAVPSIDAQQLAALRRGEDLRSSVAGRIGGALSSVLGLAGFDWRIATALIGAFAAKEVFVAQMGIVYSLGEVDETSEGLRAALRRDYPPRVGLALILFLLIAAPCMATVAITRKESGTWRWAAFQFGGLTFLGFTLAVLVYQVGGLLP